MNKKSDYILKDTTWVLHWINRKDFVDYSKSIINNKIHNNVVLFVSCNSYKALNQCIMYLKTESDQDFDIIVVDNSTNSEEMNSIQSLWADKKISIVKPIENIWWSWGFSIWMEYIISKWYDKLVCFEDDIIPINRNIISETMKLLTKEKIVSNMIYWTWSWWPFHLTGYSVKFLKETLWVVDPRFFLKYDDVDIAHRIDKLWLWKTKINTWKVAFHPLMKKNMRKPRVLCFTVRNLLLYTKKYPNNFFGLFRDLFIYILYGFSFYIITNQIDILYAVLYGIFSFLFCKAWIYENKNIIKKFIGCLPSAPKHMQYFVWNKDECNNLLKDKYYLYWKLTWNYEPTYNQLKISGNFRNWKNNWVVMLWYLSPFFWFTIPFKKIFYLDDYLYNEKKFYVSILDNNIRLKYFKIILSFFASFITYTLIIILIVIKIIISIILRQK